MLLRLPRQDLARAGLGFFHCALRHTAEPSIAACRHFRLFESRVGTIWAVVLSMSSPRADSASDLRVLRTFRDFRCKCRDDRVRLWLKQTETFVPMNMHKNGETQWHCSRMRESACGCAGRRISGTLHISSASSFASRRSPRTSVTTDIYPASPSKRLVPKSTASRPGHWCCPIVPRHDP
ncbi:hypothetical protein C8F01DRAFT_1161170 [Mycena amicta]|nr:hypothetical protein C8F01DRAFT_1161170 [Mycena amicta]